MQGIRLKCLAGATAVLWLAHSLPVEGSTASERKARPDTITPLLEARLKAGVNLEDIVVEVRWPFDTKHPVCRIWGNGVGTWDRGVQFRLSQPEATSLLQALTRARFGSLPDTVGGVKKEKKTQKGQVTVSIGTVTKTVVQLERGEQSQKLQSIAEDFLRASRRAAERGVRVSSFADGFQKLAVGTLAPEAFEVLVERKTRPPGERTQQSWTLRLDGRRASVRVMRGAEVQGAARGLVVSKAEFDALLRLLRDSDLETLPRNLYSAHDTNVRIQVLDQVCVVQARPFPGMTQRTHGVKQKSFDRISAALLALHGRVEKEGTPLAGEARISPRRTAGD